MFRRLAALVAAVLLAAPLFAANATTSSQVVGEWTIELSPAEKAQFESMKLAFREPPPTEEELAALSEEERMMVAMMMMAAQDENDPKVAEMKALVQSMDKTMLVVTADTMTIQIGETAESTKWKVKSQSDAGLVVVTTDSDGNSKEFTMVVDGDSLTMTPAASDGEEAPKPMRFTR